MIEDGKAKRELEGKEKRRKERNRDKQERKWRKEKGKKRMKERGKKRGKRKRKKRRERIRNNRKDLGKRKDATEARNGTSHSTLPIFQNKTTFFSRAHRFPIPNRKDT